MGVDPKSSPEQKFDLQCSLAFRVDKLTYQKLFHGEIMQIKPHSELCYPLFTAQVLQSIFRSYHKTANYDAKLLSSTKMRSLHIYYRSHLVLAYSTTHYTGYTTYTMHRFL